MDPKGLSLLLLLTLTIAGPTLAARKFAGASAAFTADLDAGLKAMKGDPNYSSISQFSSSIRSAVLSSGAQSLTLLAPNNDAVSAAASYPWVTPLIMTKLGKYLSLPQSYTLAQLRAIKPNAQVTTMGGYMIKTSGVAATAPVTLRSPKSATPVATVLKTLYVGKFVSVYGLSAILQPSS